MKILKKAQDGVTNTGYLNDWLDKYPDGGTPVKPLIGYTPSGDISSLPRINLKPIQTQQQLNQNTQDNLLKQKQQQLKDVANQVNQNKTTISSYTPKQGDDERRAQLNQQYANQHGGYTNDNGDYVQGAINDFADSKLANNIQDRLVEPIMTVAGLLDGVNLAKGALKEGIDYLPQVGDWLKNQNIYKNIPEGTQLQTNGFNLKNLFKPKFESEINWSNWNKEIPNDNSLLTEYNNIEKTTKNAGTWMKNSDGTIFKGTPEQFVQMNSKNVISYSGGSLKTSEAMYEQDLYRGAHQHIDDFANRDRNDYATFLTSDKKNAATYADINNDISEKFYHPDINKLGEFEDGLYQLGMPQNLPKVVGDAKGRSWRELDFDNKIAKGIDPERLKNDDLFKYLTTDDYASYVKNNTEGIAEIKNVRDQMGSNNNGIPSTVYAVDANKVPLKSLRYNNGKFNVSNSNIYKTIVPGAAGLGTLALQQNDKQYKEGGWLNSYNEGGNISNTGYKNDSPDRFNSYNIIPSNNITMKNVSHPIIGISDIGHTQIMYPEQDYKFKGNSVIEYPLKDNDWLKNYK